MHFGEEGRHIYLSREGQQVASCRNMQTRATQTGEETTSTKNRRLPSTRGSRDYSVKINWTYELISALYQRHLDKSKYWYSRQMKDLWDQCQPKYAHLSSKHLTMQITRVIAKGLIRQTGESEESGRGSAERRADEENNVEIEQDERLSAEIYPDNQSTQTTAEMPENQSQEDTLPEKNTRIRRNTQ